MISRGCDRWKDHCLRPNIGRGCDRRKDHEMSLGWYVCDPGAITLVSRSEGLLSQEHGHGMLIYYCMIMNWLIIMILFVIMFMLVVSLQVHSMY